ncbi:MAG: hypothetical protein RLP44_22060 [Aggregatilineales bacterium]
MPSPKFKLFGEIDIQNYISKKRQEVTNEIKSAAENHILNVNEIDYIAHLVSKYSIDPIVIEFDKVSISDFEDTIKDRHGISYRVTKIVYHLPFYGDSHLLRCQPSHYFWTSHEVYIKNNELCFEIIADKNNSERTRKESEDIRDSISQYMNWIAGDLSAYNNELEVYISSSFKYRKDELLKKNELIASLGVPIKKRNNLPSTFAVPSVRKRLNIPSKPQVHEKGFKPEPTLPNENYQEILKTIFDVGKNIERLPSIYENKNEEGLRDYFLLALGTVFEKSTTGETFNKSGKTDILIRHENSNIFVAECKIWKGEKGYRDTITQLLGYLTWRDSKTAVIMFVKNKDLSNVFAKVEEVTPQHSNYLGFEGKHDDGWYKYRFHINGDRNREVKTSVLLFHLP